MSSVLIAPLVVLYSVDDDVMTLTRTAAVDSTASTSGGTTQLSKAALNKNGPWSFSTDVLSNRKYSFTATDLNAAPDISRGWL